MVQAFEDSRPRPIRPLPSTPRVPPHNLEAEESLLGAMLLSNDAASAAMEICESTDFYKPAHGHIFSAIRALFERGEAVDAVTVTDELRRSGLLEAVGDPALLVSLQANTPSIANALHYAKIVEEHSLLRRLVGVAGEIADIGYSVPEDVAGAVDRAEQMVFDVNQRRTMVSIQSLGDLLGPSLDRIEMLANRHDSITGLATGYVDLDEMLAGLQPSSLTIVGARPSMGKTSFALGIVAHAGVVSRKPVLLFSLEMGHFELTQRILASEALVDAHRLRIGQLQEPDWPKVSRAISRLSDAPIFIDDNPNLTVMDIRARARRLKKKEGELGLVVVDYLQLMTGRQRAENRQVEVAEISRGLKILARELEVPVVALSQLSRGLEARADKRPMLSDLRESGSLEQDADVVVFIYREEQYDADAPLDRRGVADIIVAKHRNGRTGTIQLAFRTQYARFDNMKSP
jgi:replicative DNA helicase